MKALTRFRLICSSAMAVGFLAACSIFSSCTSGGGGGLADTGYGPFDSRGNYVEAWADNPSKWNRRIFSRDASPDGDEASLLAANDTPPSNLTPIASSPSSEPKASSPSGSSAKSRTASVTSSTSAKPKTSTTVKTASTSTKSKTVASKPRGTRVVVKKGDTLSALAMRHGSSVTAIQRANGMRDTKLAIGRSLVIPRL